MSLIRSSRGVHPQPASKAEATPAPKLERGPRVDETRVALEEVLGPGFSLSELSKLAPDELQARAEGLDRAWRRWVAHEHGRKAPEGVPDRAALERGLPVLHALIRARTAERAADDAVADPRGT